MNFSFFEAFEVFNMFFKFPFWFKFVILGCPAFSSLGFSSASKATIPLTAMSASLTNSHSACEQDVFSEVESLEVSFQPEEGVL